MHNCFNCPKALLQFMCLLVDYLSNSCSSETGKRGRILATRNEASRDDSIYSISASNTYAHISPPPPSLEHTHTNKKSQSFPPSRSLSLSLNLCVFFLSDTLHATLFALSRSSRLLHLSSSSSSHPSWLSSSRMLIDFHNFLSFIIFIFLCSRCQSLSLSRGLPVILFRLSFTL